MLKEFTDELVDSAEAKRVEKFTAKAKEAGLPEKVVIEVRADSHYGSGKKTVKLALPRVGAKWLTKSGISSEWRDEVQLLSGMAALRFQGSRLERKLDKLIELKKKKEEEIQKSEQEQRVGKILPKQPVTLSAALAARTNQSNENKTESPS